MVFRESTNVGAPGHEALFSVQSPGGGLGGGGGRLVSHLSDSRGFPDQPSPGTLWLCGKLAVRSPRVPEKVAESEDHVR